MATAPHLMTRLFLATLLCAACGTTADHHADVSAGADTHTDASAGDASDTDGSGAAYPNAGYSTNAVWLARCTRYPPIIGLVNGVCACVMPSTLPEPPEDPDAWWDPICVLGDLYTCEGEYWCPHALLDERFRCPSQPHTLVVTDECVDVRGNPLGAYSPCDVVPECEHLPLTE